jgi:hypothetical protein
MVSSSETAEGAKGTEKDTKDGSDPSELDWTAFPPRFLSLHVRYGMKVHEVDLQPLSRYMAMAQGKLPHLRDVFVSTETEAVLDALIRCAM